MPLINLLEKHLSKLNQNCPISMIIYDNQGTEADVIIDIGKPYYKEPSLFSFENNYLINNGKIIKKPYGGIVKFALDDNNTPHIIAYGNRIEGTITSVKKMINSRDVIFSEILSYNAFSKALNLFTYYIEDTSPLGIAVFDLLHNLEAKNNYYNNNDFLGKNVEKILLDKNFGVSIKPVKTLNTTSYGESTLLRVKHVHSELNENYTGAFGVSDKPVVLSRGIHSNLLSWEDFGKDLASKGQDVWLIEMVGGPYTDENCGSSCPNYTFADLKDYYWPALIAGIQEYSGKDQIDYVGFSLGCSAALESLESHQNGENNIGYYLDYNTGQYVYSDLSANPVDTFVGVGCPGNFTKLASLIWLAKKSEDNFNIIQNLKDKGRTHITMTNLIVEIAKNVKDILDLPPDYLPFDTAEAMYWEIAARGVSSMGDKMSIEIYQEFMNWMDNPNQPKLGENVNVTNALLIQGKLDKGILPLFFGKGTDGIVANADIAEACSNVQSNNKYYVSFDNKYHIDGPLINSLPTDSLVQKKIKEFIQNQEITESNEYTMNNKNNCSLI